VRKRGLGEEKGSLAKILLKEKGIQADQIKDGANEKLNFWSSQGEHVNENKTYR